MHADRTIDRSPHRARPGEPRQRRGRRDRGASLTEYAFITALVAVACMMALTALSNGFAAVSEAVIDDVGSNTPATTAVPTTTTTAPATTTTTAPATTTTTAPATTTTAPATTTTTAPATTTTTWTCRWRCR